MRGGERIAGCLTSCEKGRLGRRSAKAREMVKMGCTRRKEINVGCGLGKGTPETSSDGQGRRRCFGCSWGRLLRDIEREVSASKCRTWRGYAWVWVNWTETHRRWQMVTAKSERMCRRRTLIAGHCEQNNQIKLGNRSNESRNTI